MPYYGDSSPYYYGAPFANHSSLMTGTARTLHGPLSSRFAPHLSTITESPLSNIRRYSPVSVATRTRRIIDTADIDVSTPRTLTHDSSHQRPRLRRDRPTIKIRSQALKDNPALRQHNEKHEKTVGELLVEKFLIKDKKSDGKERQLRLHHQVSLDRGKAQQDLQAIHRRITRRMTRRRSSADLQLDPEQLQREITYAQVQAEVLDSLVAEEQAEIEDEVRRGTLIRKGTIRGPRSVPAFFPNDVEQNANQNESHKVRKTLRRIKKKKKMTEKPSPTDEEDESSMSSERPSSDSSEVELTRMDEIIKAKQNDDLPKPQMYKIEACNSAGDFSTLWVNKTGSVTDDEVNSISIEQFRESVKIPVPRKMPIAPKVSEEKKRQEETETQVVLPVRKPYVKDTSRNSVYFTVKKPVEKKDEEDVNEKKEILTNGMGALSKDDSNSETAHFAWNRVSREEVKPEEPKKVPERIETKMEETSGDTSESTQAKETNEQDEKKDLATLKKEKLLAILKKEQTYRAQGKTPNLKAEVEESGQKEVSKPAEEVSAKKATFEAADAKKPRSGLITVDDKRTNEQKSERKNEGKPAVAEISRKTAEVSPSLSKEKDKQLDNSADSTGVQSKSQSTSVGRDNLSIANDGSEKSSSSASSAAGSVVSRLPKASKINADGNNAVEAPELSLREASHLPKPTAGEWDVQSGSKLPGKTVDKGATLKKITATNAAGKPTGVAAPTKLPAQEVSGLASDTNKVSDAVTLPEPLKSEERKDDGQVEKTGKLPSDKSGVKSRSEMVVMKDTEVPPAKNQLDKAKDTNAAKPKQTTPLKLQKTELDKVGGESPKSPPKNEEVSKIGANKFKVATPLKTLRTENEKDSTASGKITVNKVSNAEPVKDAKSTNVAVTKIANDKLPEPTVPKFGLKKSTSVDPSKTGASSADVSPLIKAGPKAVKQSTSLEESSALKKTAGNVKSSAAGSELANGRIPEAVESGQISKSASTESIDFWSEINAPEISKTPTIKKQPANRIAESRPAVDGIKPGIKTDIKPGMKLADSERSKTGESTTAKSITTPTAAKAAPPKELADKKKETDLKISAAHDSPVSESVNITGIEASGKSGGSARAANDAEEAARVKTDGDDDTAKPTPPPEKEEEPTVVKKVLEKGPKKKGGLSIAIPQLKDISFAPKKKQPKSGEVSSAGSTPSTATVTNTPETSVPASEVSTPVSEMPVPIINIVEAPTLPRADAQPHEEDEEEPKTPTNEWPDSTVAKIARWSNQSDLSTLPNATESEKDVTPVQSADASLTGTPKTSPEDSPQTSKKKRVVKRKKSGSKKEEQKSSTKKSSSKKSVKSKKASETSKKGTLTTNKSNTSTPTSTLKLPDSRSSPRNSPRNTPTQRPLDLIKMFYTTPAQLLTATPRDLSKVRRAKIKRKRHPSRNASVSSDSTGSTNSTATTESTDGSSETSTCTELDDDPEHKRMASTRSNDSGFDGSPRISNCDMACHKKCEKLTGNLCGLNQKLVAEALLALKRAPSQASDNQRNSETPDHFSSGRITPPATNLPRFKKYAVTDFNFLKVLGKGSFGKVLLAELRGTECVYAVKCLKKDVVLEDDDVECTLIERKVLTLATRHPYLCHLFCTFQTDSHLFFVMEYLNGGDLMFHIQKSGRFPEPRARFYAAEIWSGLNFLHKKGIVYRDLKLDNVLLDFDGHIRIADFGMCKLQIFLDRTADTFCGTPDYMAPEIIKGLKYNQSVDWWSFGVLLYEMLTGQSPFSGCDEDELFWSICNERPFIPRYLSQESMDILVCLLEKDSGKRPPAHEIAIHPFFQSLPWDRLERRQLEPPFKPALDHTLDTKYFDTAFTAERPRLTPVPEQILSSMDQSVFRGFSYTNPNATD